MEFDGEGGLKAGLPLERGAGAGGGGAEAVDLWGGGSGGGEGLRRKPGRAAGGVEDLNAVGEEGDGIGGEIRRQAVDGLRWARAHGEARERYTGGMGGGIRLAATAGL